MLKTFVKYCVCIELVIRHTGTHKAPHARLQGGGVSPERVHRRPCCSCSWGVPSFRVRAGGGANTGDVRVGAGRDAG